MNIYLTLFYTKDDNDYSKNLKNHLNNYKNIGIKDVFLYTDECLPEEFKWLYKDFFNKHKRGYGYWAWKPLVIYDSLKKINDGDMILYHDVGRSCYPFYVNGNIHQLANKIKKENSGIGIARGGWNHKELCKRDAFYYMGCDEKECWDLKQLSATWSFWEKSETSKKFITDWIKWSFHNKEIITDLPNKCGLPNLPEFKDHRHDQAILTNLLYLYNKNGYKIPALQADGWEKDLNNFIKITNKIRNDTTVVTSHFSEDLEWLAKKYYMFNIVLCDKKGSANIPEEVKNKFDCTSCPLMENKGSEGLAYFNYIINNYDNLSERTAFIHGHETAWHYKNPLSIWDAILVARTDKYGYISLNIKHHPGFDYSKDRNYEYPRTMALVENYWEEYFKPYLGEIPKKFSHDCCAQFIVRKDRILRHPKEAYQKWASLYDVFEKEMNAKAYQDKHSPVNYILEFIWHIIFGEDPVVQDNQRDLGYFRERFL